MSSMFHENRIICLLLALPLASCVRANTENWVITGRVTAADTGLPIGGMDVRGNVQLSELLAPTSTVDSASDGGSPGTYRLEATRNATDTYTSEQDVTVVFTDVDGANNGTFLTKSVDIKLLDDQPATVDVQLERRP